MHSNTAVVNVCVLSSSKIEAIFLNTFFVFTLRVFKSYCSETKVACETMTVCRAIALEHLIMQFKFMRVALPDNRIHRVLKHSSMRVGGGPGMNCFVILRWCGVDAQSFRSFPAVTDDSFAVSKVFSLHASCCSVPDISRPGIVEASAPASNREMTPFTQDSLCTL